MQLPLWSIYTIQTHKKGDTWLTKMALVFKRNSDYGPKDPILNEKYQEFIQNLEAEDAKLPHGNWLIRFKRHLFG